MLLFNRMNSLLCSAMLCSFVFVGGAEAQRKCGLSDVMYWLDQDKRDALLHLKAIDAHPNRDDYLQDVLKGKDPEEVKTIIEARIRELLVRRSQVAELQVFFKNNQWLTEEQRTAIMCRAGITSEYLADLGREKLPAFDPKQVIENYISEGRVSVPSGFSMSTAFQKGANRCRKSIPMIGGIAAGWGLFGSGKAEAGPIRPPLNPEDLNQLCSPSDPDSSFFNPPEPATCEPIVCPQEQPEAKVSPKPGASPKPGDSKLL